MRVAWPAPAALFFSNLGLECLGSRLGLMHSFTLLGLMHSYTILVTPLFFSGGGAADAELTDASAPRTPSASAHVTGTAAQSGGGAIKGGGGDVGEKVVHEGIADLLAAAEVVECVAFCCSSSCQHVHTLARSPACMCA